MERIHIAGESIREIVFMSDGRITLFLDMAHKVLFLGWSKQYCTEEFRQKRLVYALDCDVHGDDAAGDVHLPVYGSRTRCHSIPRSLSPRFDVDPILDHFRVDPSIIVSARVECPD